MNFLHHANIEPQICRVNEYAGIPPKKESYLVNFIKTDCCKGNFFYLFKVIIPLPLFIDLKNFRR